jgi:C4-dicarboxylate-specific signal transduction histidine kinase
VSWRIILAVAIGVALFVLDGLTRSRDALPVLYTACIVLVAGGAPKRYLPVAGALCGLAAVFWYVVWEWDEAPDAGSLRLAVSLVAIALTTLLCFLNRLAEEREREADARYRSIFDTSAFALWEADWSGVLAIIRQIEAEAGDDLEGWLLEHRKWLGRASVAGQARTMNAETLRLFGIPGPAASKRRLPEYYAERSVAEYYTESVQRGLAHLYAALMRGEQLVEAEYSTIRTSGEPLDVVVRVTRLASDESWQRIRVMAIDVTARREAQTRLDAALAELANVSRLTTLGQLAASIVHEVNQPLAAAITYGRSGLRWLAREAPQAPETADCLEQGVANAGRAAEVIARVRDLARRSAPQSAPVELGPLVDETLRLLRREMQQRGVKVRRNVAPDTPAIVGDRVQLQQVLLSLILNAAQAMAQAAEPHRQLSVAVTPRDGMVSVSVRDRGGGIAGPDADRIFQAFPADLAPEGFGRGLSICRSIVEGHGGRIWATNVGDGAEVTFSLPTEADDAGRAAQPA